MTVVPFQCAPLYRARGWLGTIPTPLGRKSPIPTGFSGQNGRTPTDGDEQNWIRTGVFGGVKDGRPGNRPSGISRWSRRPM